VHAAHAGAAGEPVGLQAARGAAAALLLAVARYLAMTRSILLLSAALLVAPPSAHAATPTADVRAAFGNTVLTIDPDGRSRKIWLQPDGTWTGLSRRGLALAGKWKVEGEKVCLTQSKPALPGSLCQKFPTDPEVGVEAKDPAGKTIRLKLVRGHVEK
jgi:hypothetical protein